MKLICLILLFLSSVYLRKLKTSNKQVGSPSFLGGLGNQFIGIVKEIIELKDINVSNRLDNCPQPKQKTGTACDRLEFYYMTDNTHCIQPDAANIATTAKGTFTITYKSGQIKMYQDEHITYGSNMQGTKYHRCYSIWVNSGKLTVTTQKVCTLTYSTPTIVNGGYRFEMGGVDIGWWDTMTGNDVLKFDFDGSKLKIDVYRNDGGKWNWKSAGDVNTNAQHGFEVCAATKDETVHSDSNFKKTNCCDQKDHPQICLKKDGGGLICRPNEGKTKTVVTLYSFNKSR